MTKFISGIQLSRSFHDEVVRNIIDDFFPNLKYSAGLIDYGSDVLGYDTPISRDHEWGPRFSIFLKEEDHRQYGKKINKILSENLPYEFMGYPTNFSGKLSDGIQRLEKKSEGPVNHKIRILTKEGFFKDHLNWNIHQNLETKNWLLFPQQKLKTIRSGDIFHDDLDIESIRLKLHYYPEDVWLYLMACEWSLISQEEAFVGRCGDVNDDIGSRIIATRIIEKMMNLCFLMEKEYGPYSKWFGTAFNQMDSSQVFTPLFEKILNANNWKERENYLSKAYKLLARKHNELKITDTIDSTITDYYGRPYLVIFAHRFTDGLLVKISDPALKEIGLLGSIDQLTNSSRILEDNVIIHKMKALYI